MCPALFVQCATPNSDPAPRDAQTGGARHLGATIDFSIRAVPTVCTGEWLVWEYAISTLDELGTVEYGVCQRSTKLGTPTWRRHLRGRRFDTLNNALFAPQGARMSCLGRAKYAKDRYSSSDKLFVPYVGAWLGGSDVAFLVRGSAPSPEVILTRATLLDELVNLDEQSLTNNLAVYFGLGAEESGVRILSSNRRIETL